MTDASELDFLGSPLHPKAAEGSMNQGDSVTAPPLIRRRRRW